MALIVDLSEYRSQRAAQDAQPRRNSPTQQAGIRPGPHYFCTRCETDRFKLFAAGTIHCANCGALMRNISVAESGQGKSGSK